MNLADFLCCQNGCEPLCECQRCLERDAQFRAAADALEKTLPKVELIISGEYIDARYPPVDRD